ncbi:MAG: type VI secretion system lipoprotein TssJ [Steroidobacteraceae bacterium]
MTGASEGTAARRRRRHIAGALAVFVTMLAGCAHPPPPAPPPAPPPQPLDVEVRVIAAPDLNPNRSGRPSPVFLRVFELRDPSKFLSAEFDDVTLHADSTLAGTLIGREERMVEPGSTVALALKIDPATRLLGVVAEYSDLANSRWRATSPAPPGGLLTLFKDQSLVIILDRQAVTAAAVLRDKGK